MALDVAMGGSTNTILHLLAAAQEGEVDFDLADIDALSRRVPCLCKVAPNGGLPHGGRAPGRRHPGDPRRAATAPACSTSDVRTVHAPSLRGVAGRRGTSARRGAVRGRVELFHAAPGGVRTTEAVLARRPLELAGHRRRRAAASATSSTPTPRTAAWPCCTATSPPDGAVVKTAGVDEELWHFAGPGAGRRVPGGGRRGASSAKQVQPGDVVVIRYEGPRGRPGHAGDAAPDRPSSRAPGSARRAR